MVTVRIDKFLAHKAFGTRKEVHDLIKQGLVKVNDSIVKKKDMHINPDVDVVTVQDQVVQAQLEYYIKFHKPAGYVTAVEDSTDPTIMELLPEEFQTLKVFPVGRLDKDTEGLLLLTNDGPWAHKIIHGKKNIGKTYYVEYSGALSDEGIQRIQAGIVLGDGTECKPAELSLHNDEGVMNEFGEIIHSCELTIYEGKYHQVKRMIGACGGTVTYLQRIAIGRITLDSIEEVGTFIDLTEEEKEMLMAKAREAAK